MKKHNNFFVSRKKALTLGDAFPAVLTVLLVGILLVASMFLIGEIQTSISEEVSDITINETIGPITEIGIGVANASVCNFGNFNVITAINGSSFVIDPANFTASNGVVAFTGDDLTYNNTEYNVTHTFRRGGAVCQSAEDLSERFGDTVPLIGLILIIVMIAIVIGVLVSSFFVQGKGRV